MMLALKSISKSYGDNLVLDRVTIELTAGKKIGLVGANGAGKSTLLKIVAGEVEQDSGRVQIADGVEVGYLAQVFEATQGLTVNDLFDRTLGSLTEIEDRLRMIEMQMASGDTDTDRPDTDRLKEYGSLQEAYERRGGYDRAYRIEQLLAGLSVDHIPRDATFVQLSGGEQARIGLAALLLKAPDLLLLDEPTNHLDFQAAEWLEAYLAKFRGGMLVVSHDRRFLNNVAQAIIEIDEHSHRTKSYSGNYDYYAATKAHERIRWQNEYDRQQEEVHELRRAISNKARQVAHNRPTKDGDKYIKAFKAGRVEGVIARNVRSAEEKLRRIEQDPVPRPPRKLKINPDFDAQALVSRSPLTVSGLCKSYGAHSILRDVSFSINASTRAVIIGPNGVGKSTLLRIIAGIERQDAGEVDIGGTVIIGYLDQQQETLPLSGSVYEAYRGDRTGGWEQIKAELLNYGLFTYPDLAKPVSALSVGQKRKLQIACLIARRANLLLLDEPTNHVSLDVLEEFETALLEFPGPVIAVSHDRQFIDRFANEIWELRDGRLRRYLGNWEQYRQKTKIESPTYIKRVESSP